MKDVFKLGRYLLAPTLALSLVLSGCDDGAMGPPGRPGESIVGDQGPQGPQGPAGPPGSVVGGIDGPITLGVHDLSEPMFNENAAITSVTVTGDAGVRNVNVSFSVPGYPRNEVRAEFTLAKWVADKGSWMSMLPRAVADTNNPTVGNVIRGGNLRMEGATALTGTNGDFSTTLVGAGSDYGGANPIDFGQGAAWRRANEALAATYAPEAGTYRDYVQAIINEIDTLGSWDENAIYRVSVTSRTNAGQPERFNAVAYFTGAGALVTDPAAQGVKLLDTASCMSCHGERVVFNAHGAQRHDPNVCANCHNDYTFDRGNASSATANGWSSLSLTNMIHKIHSNVAGYTVDSKPFDHVRFPDYAFARDGQPRNCAACHLDNDTSWNRNDVSVAADCATCHFDGGAPFRANHETFGWFNCSQCHGESGFLNGFLQTPDAYHGVSAKLAEFAAALDYQLEIIRVENAVASAAPMVTWGIKDADGNSRTLNLADFSGHLRIGLGWGYGEDWVNDGIGPRSTGAAGDPLFVVINAESTSVSGTQATTTFPVLPANAQAGRNGYVTIMVEGEGNTGIDTGAATRVKPNTVIGTFTLGENADNPTNQRREIVSAANCMACHSNIDRHGTRANADIMGCVSCHNAGSLSRNASISQGTVDFMYIIHAIHSVGEKRKSFDRRRDHGYEHVTYPNTILDCAACHVNGSEAFPVDFTKRLGVIADGMKDEFLAGTGVNSPTASVCYSCHQDTDSFALDAAWRAHMSSQTGNMFGGFGHEDYTRVNRAEACIACHQ